jgi:hypothetical protein
MTGVKWLFDTAIEMAVNRQIRYPRMTIERVDPHRFALGNSRMVGSKLDIRYGVRCLTIEAGWTRSPSDGVMRGRALAHARVLHFGLPRHDENLKLVRGDTLPQWLSESGNAIESSDLSEHFDRLLDL